MTMRTMIATMIPVEAAEHTADALPNARLVTLENCGDFSYLECPDGVRQAIDAFFRSAAGAGRPR